MKVTFETETPICDCLDGDQNVFVEFNPNEMTIVLGCNTCCSSVKEIPAASIKSIILSKVPRAKKPKTFGKLRLVHSSTTVNLSQPAPDGAA